VRSERPIQHGNQRVQIVIPRTATSSACDDGLLSPRAALLGEIADNVLRHLLFCSPTMRAEDYRTFGNECAQLDRDLTVLRVGRSVLQSPNGRFGEPQWLIRFSPSAG
jgi:hypothetical protein